MSYSLLIHKDLISSGQYKLKGKVAIKVVGDSVKHIDGIADPVYVVSDEEVAAGDFKVAAGRPVQITASRSARGVRGHNVQPVYVVSGTAAHAAWLPEFGLPGTKQLPIARFDFMDQGYKYGWFANQAVSVEKKHTIRQPYMMLSPWFIDAGVVFNTGYLPLPEELQGKQLVVIMNNGNHFEVSSERLENFSMPIQELIFYEDELTHEERVHLTGYINAR